MNRIAYLLLGVTAAMLLPLQTWAGPVNVNKADAETISAELKGVGLTKARAIVEYRETHGPFHAAADLSEVKGIGERTIEINRDNIKLQNPGETAK